MKKTRLFFGSVEVVFGVAKEVREGSFRKDLFGYYGELNSVRMIEDPRVYASILMIKYQYWLES